MLADLNGDAVDDVIAQGLAEDLVAFQNVCQPMQQELIPGQVHTFSQGPSLGLFDCLGPGWAHSAIADWDANGQNSVVEFLAHDVIDQVTNLTDPIPQGFVGPHPPYRPTYTWTLGGAGMHLVGGTVANTGPADLLSFDPPDASLMFNLGFNGGPPAGQKADDFIASRAFDIDGDGLPDMTFIGSGTSSAGSPSVPGYVTYFSTRDRNGAGHPFRVPGSVRFSPPNMDPTRATTDSSQAMRAIADVDGDGLADLIIANKGVSLLHPGTGFVAVAVMPNRGDGRFGVPGSMSDTAWDGYGNDILAGTTPQPDMANISSGIHLLGTGGGTASNPLPTDALSSDDLQSSTIRFGDLNGDGFADFALLDQTGLWICLRYGGYWDSAHWRCTGDTTFKQVPPTTDSSDSPAVVLTNPQQSVNFATDSQCLPRRGVLRVGITDTIVPANILIGDLNGSGVNQVVFFPSYDSGHMDSCTIENTVFDCRPTCNALPTLVGGSTSGQPTALRVSPGGGFSGVRDGLLQSISNGLGARMTFEYSSVHDLGKGDIQVPRWVVTKVATGNGLLGSQATRMQKSYSYDTPLYDGRDRLFVGFRKVTETTSDDPSGHSPGATVRTTFATATNYVCATTFDPSSNAMCASGTQVPEAMIRASRGQVSLVEVSDSSGTQRISSTVHHVEFVSPYTGLDGRTGVTPASRTEEVHVWGGSASAPAALVPASVGLGVSLPAAFAALPATGPHIVRGSLFDANGNEIETQDRGVVQATSLVNADKIILTDRVWLPPFGDQSAGWSFRVTKSTTGYAGPGLGVGLDKSQPFREMDYDYDAQGRLIDVSAPVINAIQELPGPFGGPRAAGQPQTAVFGSSTHVTLRALQYDAFGNVKQVGNEENPCLVSVAYDAQFTQLPVTQTFFPNSVDCATGGIQTTRTYDRRLDLVTSVMSNSEGMTIAQYDDFGRIKELDAPNTMAAFGTTVVFQAEYQDTKPVRRVHTRTGSGLGGGTAAASFTDHYRYVDGLGATRAVVDAIDPDTHDGSTFVTSGVYTTFNNGRVASVFQPHASSGPAPAGQLPPEASAPTGPSASATYDALGRAVTISDFLGHISMSTYIDAALSMQVQDAEQLSGLTHGGSTTTARDGHGRVVTTDVHLENQNGPGMTANPVDIVTAASYQPTGEPTSITQSSPSGTFTRSLIYDSLGHLVQQTEPNTGTWTYAYDSQGRLVGTADARGCGKNLVYDLGGRLEAADYSPCTLNQPIHSDPQVPASSSNPSVFPYPGAEESYAYDDVFNGRLTRVADRGRMDMYFYHTVGLPLDEIRRQVALPIASTNSPTVYGATHVKAFAEYDVMWRPMESSVLASGLAGQAGGPSIDEIATYDANGRVTQISSPQVGTILQHRSFKINGLLEQQQFGDAANTTATYDYDANLTLLNYSVVRGDGPWVTGVPGYSPPQPQPNGLPDPALQGNLTEITINRDLVGNPLSVVDATAPGLPTGSQPVSQNYTYTDDYRLSTVTTTSATDPWVNPYGFESSTGSTLYPQPASLSSGSTRLRSQSFTYDLRGNITSSTDDTFTSSTPAFYDRSLGGVTLNPGTDRLSSAAVPGATPGGPGTLGSVVYDDAGNLGGFLVESATTTSDYSFQWDELGRLASASRTDFPVSGAAAEVVETYLYTAGGQRVQTAKAQGSADPIYTVNLFDSLVLKDAPLDVNGDYTDDVTTEQVYLAGGLARVFDDVQRGPPGSPPQPGTMPQASTSTTVAHTIHTFLNIADHRGSGAFVIDKDSGELVERTSYHAYGAIDTDYRPSRWSSSREDDKFIGQWDNAEVGLIYLNARYYSPQLGRFISPDPQTIHGLAGDPNPYAYAHGNPIANIDPSGLDDGSENSEPIPSGPTYNANSDSWGYSDPDTQTTYVWASAPPGLTTGGGSAPEGPSIGPDITEYSYGIHLTNYVPGGADTWVPTEISIWGSPTNIKIPKYTPPTTRAQAAAERLEWFSSHGVEFAAMVATAGAGVPGMGAGGIAAADVGVGELGLALAPAEGAGAVEGTTTLYRVASEAEVADIEAFQGFRGGGLTQMEVKLFATSEEDAGFFARDVMYPLAKQQSWVVRVDIPDSLARQLYRFIADGKPTVAVEPELLEQFNAVAKISTLPYVPVPTP
jgi:RHS repeat-associated protein